MADRDPGPFVADPLAYDTDVLAWTLAQTALLRARQFEALDLTNLIEEIGSLGREQGHAVQSYLVVLLEHLLKLAVSVGRLPRRKWRRSAAIARAGIERRLRDSPSLKPRVSDLYAEAWIDARRLARLGLREAEEHLVPAAPPFTLEQALDPDWFPPAPVA